MKIFDLTTNHDSLLFKKSLLWACVLCSIADQSSAQDSTNNTITIETPDSDSSGFSANDIFTIVVSVSLVFTLCATLCAACYWYQKYCNYDDEAAKRLLLNANAANTASKVGNCSA